MADQNSTKERILDEALTLFSEKGYANVYVGEIAERVGIKAPSLYKHFKNKRAIFEGILGEMEQRFLEQAGMLNISGNDAVADVARYEVMDEDTLLTLGTNLFLYFLHDDFQRRVRKMLTIEQFQDAELAAVYQDQYVDSPLNYQAMMFGMLTSAGVLKAKNEEESVSWRCIFTRRYICSLLCATATRTGRWSRSRSLRHISDSSINFTGGRRNESYGDKRDREEGRYI